MNTKFITNNTINFENEEENNVNECVMVDDSEFNKNNNYFYGVKKNNYVRSFNPRLIRSRNKINRQPSTFESEPVALDTNVKKISKSRNKSNDDNDKDESSKINKKFY